MSCVFLYRAFAPGVLDKDVFGLQTLQHMMRMTRTWDSTMSMIPKGGDTIWGGLDWSPDNCSTKKKNNGTSASGQKGTRNNGSAKGVNYGKMVSFGKDVAALHSSEIERIDFRVLFCLSKKFHNMSSSNNYHLEVGFDMDT